MNETSKGRGFRWKHPVRDIVLLVVGLVLCSTAYVVVWAYTARGGSSIDYTAAIVELVRTRQPPLSEGETAAGGRENAWDVLKEAIAAYETARAAIAPANAAGGGGVVEWDLLRDEYQEALEPYEAEDEAIRAAFVVTLDARRATAEAGVPIMALSPLGASLERLARTPGGERGGYTTPLFGTLLPELGSGRHISRYLAARMRLAGATGDSATVLACFEQVLAVARVIAHQPTLIDRLVACVMATMAMDEMRRYAETGSLSADDAGLALEAMDRQLAWPGMELAFEGERVMGHDFIQFTHSEGGLIPGRMLITQYEAVMGGGPGSTGPFTPMRNLSGLLAPSKRRSTIALDALYDRMIEHAARTPEERAANPFSPDAFIDALGGDQPALELIVPALGKAMERVDQHEASMAATRERLQAIIGEATGQDAGEAP